jgi:hypothetical protein
MIITMVQRRVDHNIMDLSLEKEDGEFRACGSSSYNDPDTYWVKKYDYKRKGCPPKFLLERVVLELGFPFAMLNQIYVHLEELGIAINE